MIQSGNTDIFVKGKPIRNPFNRILVIQIGDIGDVIWATPTLHAIREHYPDSALAVLVRPGVGALLTADPCVDEVFEVVKNSGGIGVRLKAQARLLQAIRRYRFDLVIDLRAGDRGAYMSFLSGAPTRLALHYPDLTWRNLMFTHLVSQNTIKQNVRGASEQSLCVVRGLGIETKNRTPHLSISDETKIAVDALLHREGLFKKPFITVNPFSRWSYKEWKPNYWQKVLEWMWHVHKVRVVIVGSAQEQERAKAYTGAHNNFIHNLAGKTDLAQLAGLVRRSMFHLGVDSAAVHIAAAVGTPTLTLYGPSDWRDWAPVGDRHHIVDASCDNGPCYQKGCDGNGISQCLDALTPDSVIDSLLVHFPQTVFSRDAESNNLDYHPT